MADYLIPNINGDMMIPDPIITKVLVSYDDTMADDNIKNLTVLIETPARFSVELGHVTFESMDYDKTILFAKAQSSFDAQFKVE